MPTRRQYLASLGAAAGAGGLVFAASTPAAGEHYSHQPEHVTLSFDEDAMIAHRPLLVLRELDVRPLGLYGLIATSPEFDTDAYVYCASYSHQKSAADGWVPNPPDEHFGDHEWFYVFVDSDTGELVEVVYTAYHWLAGRSVGDAIPTYEDSDGVHPKAHVVKPWHQYYLTSENGQFVPDGIEDLTGAFQSWLDNDMEKDLQPGTVVEPWWLSQTATTDPRDHWWRDAVGSVSPDALYARTLYDLGVLGADKANPAGGGAVPLTVALPVLQAAHDPTVAWEPSPRLPRLPLGGT